MRSAPAWVRGFPVAPQPARPENAEAGRCAAFKSRPARRGGRGTVGWLGAWCGVGALGDYAAFPRAAEPLRERAHRSDGHVCEPVPCRRAPRPSIP